MCTQDLISVRCPTCWQELSYHYTPLEACRSRGQCFVHRREITHCAYQDCERCAQKRRETEIEARRREEEKVRREMSEEAEREAERDRTRKADRRHVEEEKETERAATSRESRCNKRKYSSE